MRTNAPGRNRTSARGFSGCRIGRLESVTRRDQSPAEPRDWRAYQWRPRRSKRSTACASSAWSPRWRARRMRTSWTRPCASTRSDSAGSSRRRVSRSSPRYALASATTSSDRGLCTHGVAASASTAASARRASARTASHAPRRGSARVHAPRRNMATEVARNAVPVDVSMWSGSPSPSSSSSRRSDQARASSKRPSASALSARARASRLRPRARDRRPGRVGSWERGSR
jgi:hypothetical protein